MVSETTLQSNDRNTSPDAGSSGELREGPALRAQPVEGTPLRADTMTVVTGFPRLGGGLPSAPAPGEGAGLASDACLTSTLRTVPSVPAELRGHCWSGASSCIPPKRGSRFAQESGGSPCWGPARTCTLCSDLHASPPGSTASAALAAPWWAAGAWVGMLSEAHDCSTAPTHGPTCRPGPVTAETEPALPVSL